MNNQHYRGHLAMLITALIFGANIPLSKNLMPQWISPIGLTYSRFVFGAIAFWTISLFLKTEKVSRKDMKTLFIGSLLGVGLNQGSFIAGLQRTSAINASIVITITPILAMIISFFMLKEPITLKKVGGVLIGFVGVLSMILTSEFVTSANDPSIIGDLLCLLSSLSYAFFLVYTKGISQKYSSITLMKWMFLFSAVLFYPLGSTDLFVAKIFYEGSQQARFCYFYMLLGATLITYLLIPVAQRAIRPTTIGMYNYLQPIVATSIAVFLGQDIFSWTKPLSAALIFIGFYFVTTSKSREDIERASAPVFVEPIASHEELYPVKEPVNK